MRVQSLLAVLVLTVAGCGSTSPEMQLINDAATAMGGADRINAVSTLVLEGTGQSFNLGQNLTPEADLPRYDVTAYRKAFDFTSKRWRQELTRVPTFATPNNAPQTQITAVDAGVAFNVGGNGAAARQNDQVGRDRGAEVYHHPVSILQAALAEGAQAMSLRTAGSEQTVDIVLPDGTGLTLSVDSATKLPTRVQSIGYNANLGDVIMETAFAGYQDVDGLQLPTTITSSLDRFTLAEVNVTSAVNGDAGDLMASDEVKSATVQVAMPMVEVEQVAPGLWYLRGGSHHSVVYEFSDHLTLIEAPQNDARTLAAIEAARGLNPDKPLTEVINTHHHFDHSGGVRAAISQGLTLITHEGNRAFYEDVAGRPHTLQPDALQANPQPLQLRTVGERTVLTDGTRTIELYPLTGSQHSETMLLVYFPNERILSQADLYTPAAANAQNPRFPNLGNMLDNIRGYNLNVGRFMPIHGPGLATMAQAQAAQRTETAAAAAPAGD